MSDPSARRWAALHAASLPPGRRQTPAAVRAEHDFDLGPTVLAACTELGGWELEDRNYAVALAERDGSVVLATGGRDEIVRIWDATTGSLVHELTGHQAIWAAKFGHRPDGRLLLATGGTDDTARIWDPVTGAPVCVLAGHSGTVAGVAWGYHPGERPFLVTAGQDGTARIWDPIAGELIHRLTATQFVWNAAVGYRADGRAVLATTTSDGSVSIWDPDTGRLERSISLGRLVVSSVGWGNRPGREPLLAAADSSGTRIWADWMDASSGEHPTLELPADTGGTVSMAWAPLEDGRTLLATTTDQAMLLWDGVTGQCLHSERYEFASGFNHLDWTFAPGGELLLAATSTDSRVHLWDVRLDPPARLGPVAAALRERAPARGERSATILNPPEEITPRFPDVAGIRKEIHRLSNVEQRGDQVVVAAVASGGEIQIWDVSAGALLRVINNPSNSQCVALEMSPGQAARLAVGGDDDIARIWDLDSGELLHALTGHAGDVWTVAWGQGRGGQPTLLATGEAGNGAVRIWDPDNGRVLRTLNRHSGGIPAAAWGYLDGGLRSLATGASSIGIVLIWDPDTGELLNTITGHGGAIRWAAWGPSSTGRSPLLATCGDDRTVRIWDPGTGRNVRVISGHTNSVFTVEWAALGDGRHVLVSAGEDGTAQIWDPDTGEALASVPSNSARRRAVALHTTPEGDLHLVVANNESTGPPVRVWRIATGVTPVSGPGPDSAGQLFTRQAAELPGWLLRLGGACLWPPLGLLADLMDLTGPTPAPDGRLASLADEPGIARLRALGWEPGARVAFAALIVSALTVPEQYAPPADATPATLRDELARALAEQRDTVPPSPVPVGQVRAATGLITKGTVALLAILGPAACAADPLLPVRLSHRSAQLPTLAPRELRLLAAVGRRREGGSPAAGAGTLVYSPGTAGLARTGPLTRLLPAQLALPRAMLTMRLAEHELLYREHRAPAPPAPDPVTVILDTTPPTFGPAGTVLRLAVHLMTAALWDHDRYPYLITLGEPAVMTELRHPADLLRSWAGRTLDEPAAALATALATATETGQPVVFASHFRTARDFGYRPAPATRLLTAHHPPEAPPTVVSRWHQHLPPGPTSDQLMAALAGLLSPPTAEAGN